MSQRQRSATDRGITATAGVRFAHALAAKDAAAFRGAAGRPDRFPGADAGPPLAGLVARRGDQRRGSRPWFGAGNDIEALESLSTARLPGREHVSYLLRIRNADGSIWSSSRRTTTPTAAGSRGCGSSAPVTRSCPARVPVRRSGHGWKRTSWPAPGSRYPFWRRCAPRDGWLSSSRSPAARRSPGSTGPGPGA